MPPFPGKRGAVRAYFAAHPGGTTGGCVAWIRQTFGRTVRSKRVSTIRRQLNPGVPIPRSEPMSLPSNPPPPPPPGGIRLTHAAFYKVCEALKKNRERFLAERPSHRRAAEWLTELSGTPVSENSVTEVKEATGIDWQAKHSPRQSKAQKAVAIRTLATSLVRLFRKLEEEVPSALLDLYEEETGRRPALPECGPHQEPQ